MARKHKRALAKTFAPDAALVPADMRAQIMERAGLTPERLADLLKRAVAVAEAKLTTQRTQYFTLDGAVIDQRTDDDHAIQLAAVKLLVELTGAMPSKSAGSQTSKPTNIINVIPWQPRPATVVDAEPA